MHDPFIQNELKTKHNTPADSGGSLNISTLPAKNNKKQTNKKTLLKWYFEKHTLFPYILCKSVIQQIIDKPPTSGSFVESHFTHSIKLHYTQIAEVNLFAFVY